MACNRSPYSSGDAHPSAVFFALVLETSVWKKPSGRRTREHNGKMAREMRCWHNRLAVGKNNKDIICPMFFATMRVVITLLSFRRSSTEEPKRRCARFKADLFFISSPFFKSFYIVPESLLGLQRKVSVGT